MDNNVVKREENVALADKPEMGEGLVIKNLHVNVEGREILKGVDVTVRQGEVHALMGPNGSGKSTLVNALMGNPTYKVTEGTASLNGKDLLREPPDERAKLGLFLGFQYPSSIPGVSVANFLRTALVSLTKARARTESELLREGGQVRRDSEGQDGQGQGQGQNLGLAEANYVGRGGVARPTTP